MTKLLDIKRIVWLASYPKSGNTWMRFLLTSYIQGSLDINNDANYSFSDTMVQPYQASSTAPVHLLGQRGTTLIRPAALLQLIAWAPLKQVFVKTHNANMRLNHSSVLIPPELTDRAIYLIRDPRDVAVSSAYHVQDTIDKSIVSMNDLGCMMPYKDSSTMHWLSSWSNHVGTWMSAADNSLGPDKTFPILFVRYEDLLENPKEELRQVLEFLGLTPIDEERLSLAVELCQFNNLRRQEFQHGFREQPKGRIFFRSGVAGQWRDVLTPEQVQTIETDHRTIMEAFNYEPASGEWEDLPKTPTPSKEEQIGGDTPSSGDIRQQGNWAAGMS